MFCLLEQGNLSEFVKVKPEARTYYDLEASGIKFVLPEPGTCGHSDAGSGSRINADNLCAEEC